MSRDNRQKKGEIDLNNGKRIGGGGFGEVHRISDGSRIFALKISLRTGPAEKKAFRKECEKLRKIKHPNVVKYFGVVHVKDNNGKKVGIKMEFCERGSLKDLIFNPTIIYSMKDISIWAEQLFGALVFIFEKHKIIHQDIKAENIFVAADFSLKLGDFGLFKESDGTRSGTYDGGTPRYKSPPEIPDPKKPNETLPKLSHKNDVYSMGLVLWELVERRVVFSEFNDEYGGFDYQYFCLTVYLRNLPHVQGPDCLGKMKEIVQKCTRFQRGKRPKASEIQEEIKALNQANGDLHQLTPIEDPNENRFIRPIGFNGDTNWQPIDDPLHPKSTQDARMAEGFEILKKYPVDRWRLVWNKLLDSFVHEFHSLDHEERSKFVHNIPNLIAKTLENKKIRFHEALSHLTRLGQDETWTNHPLEDVFQVIIEFNQRHTECNIAEALRSYMHGNALPWINYSVYTYFIAPLEELGSRLRSTTFYFRAFLSTETLQVWLLLEDDDDEGDEQWGYLRPAELGVVFIRNDFQLVVREGQWMNTEKSKFRVGEDDLHYLEDRQIDFHQILEKIKKQEKGLVFQARMFLNQLVSLDESQQRTESISVPNIGSDLLVENYFFQLRNPPRMDCRHHPKCSILKYTDPIGSDLQEALKETGISYYSDSDLWEKLKEIGIPYYSCSSDGSLQYLKEWCDFCESCLEIIYPFSPTDEREISAAAFILIQFKCDNQFYTLLDHPNNYEDHELIYYYDETLELHKMESSRIRKLLDEMAPEMRRYAVANREGEIIFAIEPKGN